MWHNVFINKNLVSDYLKDTIVGCEKDLAFATRWNLVTYGADMAADSNSNSDSFSAWAHSPRMMTCGHMIQRLLETPRSYYG